MMMACPGIPKRNISQRFIPQNKRIAKNAKNDVHISNEIIVKFVRLLNHTELNTSQTTSAAGIANTNEISNIIQFCVYLLLSGRPSEYITKVAPNY